MRTLPTPVVTTIPTGHASMAAVSPHWLTLAAIGFVLTLAVAITLVVINSPAHRTIPTLDRALWLRDVILTPAAAISCAILVGAVLATSQELAAARDDANSDAIDKAQTSLAEKSPTTWDCHTVDDQDPKTTTVSCIPLP